MHELMSLVMRKQDFCICENKDADQLRGNREADQRLCLSNTDSTIPLPTTSKFQASGHLLWLYSPVCVGPGGKRRRPVISQRGSNGNGEHGFNAMSRTCLFNNGNNVIFALKVHRPWRPAHSFHILSWKIYFPLPLIKEEQTCPGTVWLGS